MPIPAKRRKAWVLSIDPSIIINGQNGQNGRLKKFFRIFLVGDPRAAIYRSIGRIY